MRISSALCINIFLCRLQERSLFKTLDAIYLFTIQLFCYFSHNYRFFFHFPHVLGWGLTEVKILNDLWWLGNWGGVLFFQSTVILKSCSKYQIFFLFARWSHLFQLFNSGHLQNSKAKNDLHIFNINVPRRKCISFPKYSATLHIDIQ